MNPACRTQVSKQGNLSSTAIIRVSLIMIMISALTVTVARHQKPTPLIRLATSEMRCSRLPADIQPGVLLHQTLPLIPLLPLLLSSHYSSNMKELHPSRSTGKKKRHIRYGAEESWFGKEKDKDDKGAESTAGKERESQLLPRKKNGEWSQGWMEADLFSAVI